MKILKFNHWKTKVMLIFIGMGYFVFFSELNITPFLRGYITIIPLQILTVIYFVYLYGKNKKL